jgi:predicted RNA-binding Zn ribbon-like protein
MLECMLTMQRVAHRFSAHDFVGGHLALNFINTVTARDSQPKDWLLDFAALLDWAEQSSHFPAATLKRLRRLAAQQPSIAQAAFRRAVQLREALHRAFTALIERRTPVASDLRVLDRMRASMHRRASFAVHGVGIVAVSSLERAGLDLIADTVIGEAEGLLRAPPPERLRTCAGCDCGWLFVDTSKGGMRRWCDMQVCGTAEKSRRRAGHGAAP